MLWLSCMISNVLLATLLALAAWYVQRCLHRPGVARILWVLVLVKLLTPPPLSLPLLASARTWACAFGTCGCGPHVPTQSVPVNAIGWVLLTIWSVGAIAAGLIAWSRWARFRTLLAHAQPAPKRWQSLAMRLATELSMRTAPEILAVPGRLPPLVVPGWRRPRMLLPLELMGQLNAVQRRALLLHELIHLRRHDHLVRMLELSVHVVYWWLPVVGLISRQLRACEEASCDAAVVAHLPQARRDYARLLLDVVDFANPLPRQAIPQGTAMSAVDDLEQRLRAILDTTDKTPRGRPSALVFVGLACAVLPCELRYDFSAPTARATVATSPLIPAPVVPTSVVPANLAEPTPVTSFFPRFDQQSNLPDSVCCPK